MALTMSAQTFQRKATIVNGGGRDQGQCTVEVTVDGSAQVEIRGDNATLRNIKGQPPQWRRFECTAPVPASPTNFQLAPRAGRGSEVLVREPRNGGSAIVQIEDPQDAQDVYAFDLYWGDRGDRRGPVSGLDDRRDDRQFRNDGPDRDSGRRRFTDTEAVQACKDSVRDQAVRRFGTQNIDFLRTAMDDNPGRRDWVTGELAVRRRFRRDNVYHFSCSVNFDTGQLRSARIDQFESQYYPSSSFR
jgi:hypothetical protein